MLVGVTQSWSSRQRDASLGMVPIVAFVASGALGGWLAELLGRPEWLCVLVLAVAGFFGSRAVLRAAFARSVS
jgi:hypothetical protein